MDTGEKLLTAKFAKGSREGREEERGQGPKMGLGGKMISADTHGGVGSLVTTNVAPEPQGVLHTRDA
jgi:hypothetical protein